MSTNQNRLSRPRFIFHIFAPLQVTALIFLVWLGFANWQSANHGSASGGGIAALLYLAIIVGPAVLVYCAIPSVLFAAIVELAYYFGLSARSWAAVVFVTCIGGFCSTLALSLLEDWHPTSARLSIAFGGGAVVGVIVAGIDAIKANVSTKQSPLSIIRF